MRGRARAWLILGAVALGGASLASRSLAKGDDDDSAPAEGVIQCADAVTALDTLGKRLDDAQWSGAFDAASDLLAKYGTRLVATRSAVEKSARAKSKILGLHLPVGRALRARLANIADEGVKALAKRFESQAKALEAAIAQKDTAALEDIADRFFPLPGAARALLVAGEEYARRGDLPAAWVAWRDVVVLHPDEPSREAAAAALVAHVADWKDAATGRALVRLLERATIANGDKVLADAKAALANLDEASVGACSFDESGGRTRVQKAHAPSVVGTRIDLPDVPRALDWRHEVDQQRQQFQLPGVRRLLAGSAAVPGLLLVHLGKSILAFDPESGEIAWNVGGLKGLEGYYENLLSDTVLARYGIAVEGSTAYATLRARTKGAEPPFPEGRVVAIDLRDDSSGTVLWDSQKLADAARDEAASKKKKKKRKSDDDSGTGDDESQEKGAGPGATDEGDDASEVRLSFAGRPFFSHGRVFVGAANAETPGETWVVALDAATGTLLWKRPLATSEPFVAADRTNRWQAAMPRVAPAPACAVVRGALVVLSNNGCVAALDPETGRFLWAQSYERDEAKQEQPWRRTPEEDAAALGHEPNAPLACGDGALVLPGDSGKMFLFRASDGDLVTKRGRSGYEHVLGVGRDTVVLQAEHEIAGYRLTAQASGFSFESVWSASLGRQKAVGRGALVGRWAYVPLEKGLVAFHVTDGEKREALTWASPKREAGDLVVGGGRFYTLSARYAHAYKEEP